MQTSRLLPLLSSVLLWAGLVAHADTITVSNNSDDVTTPPPGSLRHAIVTATSGDTIEFAPTVTGTITLGGAELVLDKNLTITGPGANVLAISGNQQSRIVRVPADATVNIRALTFRDGLAPAGSEPAIGQLNSGGAGGAVRNSGNLTIESCALINNKAGIGASEGPEPAGYGGNGGAVANFGSLKVLRCQILNNRAGAGGMSYGIGGNGGGFANLNGVAEFVDCTFRRNVAGEGSYNTGGIGGAIYCEGGTTHIERSTITQNKGGLGRLELSTPPPEAGAGGGVAIRAGTLELRTSTISANICGETNVLTFSPPPYPKPIFTRFPSPGAGIFCGGGTINIVSSTVFENATTLDNSLIAPASVPGTGIFVSNSALVTVSNTIIARNTSRYSSGVADEDIAGAIGGTGYNLIGAYDSTIASLTGANVVGTRASPLDPKLGLLTDFGTPTSVHPLLANSPALDSGNDSLTEADQRGQSRPVGLHVDIGAFEGISPTPDSTLALTATTPSFVTESAGVINVSLSRTGNLASPATVRCSVSLGDTAEEGVDFTFSELVQFSPGQTEAQLSVTIVNDSLSESSESFQLQLHSPTSNATLGSVKNHTVNISDNDARFEFYTSTAMVDEIAGKITITVHRLGYTTRQDSVSYQTNAGTAGANDFTSVSGVLTFASGESSKTIDIPILDDSTVEGNETFTLELSSPSPDTSLGRPIQTVTIVDDEIPGALQFPEPTAKAFESAGQISLTVIRALGSTGTVTVNYQTNDDTAITGRDYTRVQGTLAFPDGVTQQVITVPLIDNADDAGDRKFTVVLSDPTNGASLGSPSSISVVIENNDPRTLNVTNSLDDVATPPEGSLRKAVAAAASGDIITIANSATGTIVLQGAEIALDKNLTIIGPGAAALAISGNGQSRIFRCLPSTNVTISDLTLRDGKAADGSNAPDSGGNATEGGSGGAVHNSGNLTLANCILSNNRAGDGGNRAGGPSGDAGHGGDGGAIANEGGTLTLVRCNLFENQGGKGGFFDSVVAYNSGKGGNGGSGGAIYSSGGALHLSECGVSNNLAGNGGAAPKSSGNQVPTGGKGGFGGGIYVDGIFDLERCCISNNAAGNTGSSYLVTVAGAGGGIYVNSTDAVLHTSTISGNKAGDIGITQSWAFPSPQGGFGGGIASSGTVRITSCTITNNVTGSAPVDFSGTTKTGSGGGISGNATLKNTIVSGNKIATPKSGSTAGTGPDVHGTMVFEGHNLVASPNPRLGPLTNNGGPTQTHILLDESPALEAGDDTLTGVDQRGFPRRIGAHVDIGALESEFLAERITFFMSDSDVNEGAGNASVKLVRWNPTNSTISVHYAVTADTATAGSDFPPTTGTVEFLPGELEKIITIPILEDAQVEEREFFDVSLSSPSENVFIAGISTHTVVIIDNDGPGAIEFVSSITQIQESTAAVTLTLIRKHASSGSVSVNYATANGSAVAGSDFIESNGVVTFDHGVTQQTISIPLLNDTALEADETFTVHLSNPTGGATLLEKYTHTVTIQSDDVSIVNFAASSSNVSESDGSIVVTVLRSGTAQDALSVAYQTTSGSATSGSDFTATSGTLTFGPAETEKTISVPIAADEMIEGMESFQLALSNPTSGAVLGASIHTVNILSPDGPAALSFATAASSVSESAGFATVTLVRSGTTNTAPTVRVNTSNATARAGTDFSKSSQTVTFPTGATEVEVQIKIVNDRNYEADEAFTVSLSDPGDGGTLASQTTHTVTILNDDAPATVRYRGLAERTDAPGKAGISLTKTATGKLTGSMRLRGKTLRFHAKDVNDQFIQVFSPSPKHSFAGGTLNLQFSESEGALGSFISPDGATFEIELEREKDGTARNPVAETGYYTSILDTELDGNPAGVMAVKVLPSGRVTLKGMLPDGTRLASSSHVTEGGALPVFISTYAKSTGYLGGNVEITPAEAIALSGDFAWLKPASTGSLYPASLDHTPMHLTGNLYIRPQQERIMDDYNASAGAVRLEANASGDLPQWQTSLFWETNNRIRKTAATAIDLQITLNPQTGLWNGKFEDSEGRKRRFHGICVQQQEPGEDLAAGFYIGESTSARIELEPED